MWPLSTEREPPRASDDRIRNRDILYDERALRARTRWTRVLILFLRLLSLLCLSRGLTEWGRILGFMGPEDGFELAAPAQQVMMALYAVLNCVAAVGLWLTSAWGAVLWLIVTLVEVLMPFAAGRPMTAPTLAEIALLGLIAIYMLLTVLAVRERRRHSR